jgi:hypothetical protein
MPSISRQAQYERDPLNTSILALGMGKYQFVQSSYQHIHGKSKDFVVLCNIIFETAELVVFGRWNDFQRLFVAVLVLNSL